MNFEKIKMVKVLEFILLCSPKLMIRSKELLHIDTPEQVIPCKTQDSPFATLTKETDGKIVESKKRNDFEIELILNEFREFRRSVASRKRL